MRPIMYVKSENSLVYYEAHLRTDAGQTLGVGIVVIGQTSKNIQKWSPYFLFVFKGMLQCTCYSAFFFNLPPGIMEAKSTLAYCLHVKRKKCTQQTQQAYCYARV